MACEKCKSSNEGPAPVPYVAHEFAMVRLERIVKRLWITILTLIFLLFGFNFAWLWWSEQWETVESWEIVQENDGGYNNYIGNDGDIVNGETDYPKD